jgi:hypothetical protein
MKNREGMIIKGCHVTMRNRYTHWRQRNRRSKVRIHQIFLNINTNFEFKNFPSLSLKMVLKVIALKVLNLIFQWLMRHASLGRQIKAEFSCQVASSTISKLFKTLILGH